jgi:hypothetical protein
MRRRTCNSPVSRRGALLRRVALLGMVAALLAGCGVPIDKSAHDIPPLPGFAPPDTSESTGALVATLYYLHHGRLIAVHRHATDLSPSTLLSLLIQEPSAAEISAGISSALSPSATLGLAAQNASAASGGSGTITVSLPASEFLSLTGTFLAAAYAQIVYTLMDPSNDRGAGVNVTGVGFRLGDEVWHAELPGFLVASGPVVTTRDYAAIGPSK